MTYREDRKLHRKKLSATEKRQKIQLLKAAGKTQKQVADELECSVRLVSLYWNSTDTTSKIDKRCLERDTHTNNVINRFIEAYECSSKIVR